MCITCCLVFPRIFPIMWTSLCWLRTHYFLNFRQKNLWAQWSVICKKGESIIRKSKNIWTENLRFRNFAGFCEPAILLAKLLVFMLRWSHHVYPLREKWNVFCGKHAFISQNEGNDTFWACAVINSVSRLNLFSAFSSLREITNVVPIFFFLL